MSNIRKALYLVIALFLIKVVFSLGEPITIQIISYDPETGDSNLHIQNNYGETLHDFDLYLDGSMVTRVAGSLPSGDAIRFPHVVKKRGFHNATITTREGVEVTKLLYFGLTLEQKKQEEEEKENQTKTYTQLQQDKEYQKLLELRKKKEEAKRMEEQLRAIREEPREEGLPDAYYERLEQMMKEQSEKLGMEIEEIGKVVEEMKEEEEEAEEMIEEEPEKEEKPTKVLSVFFIVLIIAALIIFTRKIEEKKKKGKK